jgi:hypothetical protein
VRKKKSMKKETRLGVIFLALFFIASIFLVRTAAWNSGSSGSANLSIWTAGAPNSENMTFGTSHGKSAIFWNFFFYSNFTNSSGLIINSTYGNCSVRFNETGAWSSWVQADFNSSSSLWAYNRSFTYKGNLSYQVNCTSSFGSITNLTDYFFVMNTEPDVVAGGVSFLAYEDNLSSHNSSQYITDDDKNDVLTYSFDSINSTTKYNQTNPSFYPWITINSSNGIIYANATNDSQADVYLVYVRANDTGDSGANRQTAIKSATLNITAVNDAPNFVNLDNRSFNATQLFDYVINVTDEENNTPFSLSITFLNCTTAEWSTRNNTNCTLFENSNYSFNSTSGVLNLSFTPTRNDVGNYTVNFTASDSGNTTAPFNATASRIVSFSVLNVNTPPFFTYVCDSERNSRTEDAPVSCLINLTDIDETNNLTIIANYSWFTLNNSALSNMTVRVNASTLYNASVLVNFTPRDLQVGNWSVNLTVIDTGSPIGVNSTVFWFFINNTEDAVYLPTIENQTVYANRTFLINASDDDLLVPDKNIKNESLTLASDTSWVSVYVNSTPSGTNLTLAEVRITHDAVSEGNYTVKINVSDTFGNYAEQNFTLYILNDTAPQWNESLGNPVNLVVYEHSVAYLNLSQNVSDPEEDAITFYFTNDTSFPSFGINSSTGIISFTPVDEDVGQHLVTINASDGKLSSTKVFNFTVYNTDDNPYLESPLQANNITVNETNSNMNTTEDSPSQIFVFVQDDDFKIPLGQRIFYNESLTLHIAISGPNTSLLNFSQNFAYPDVLGNQSEFIATFTPRKADVGNYTIILNITDKGNLTSNNLSFNLTILAVEHTPVFLNIENKTSKINSSFYYKINVSDIEDGSSDFAGNFTFNYSLLYGADLFNATTFSSSGIMNITFNDSVGGRYRINVTAGDTTGMNSSADFWLYIYDFPNITNPEGSTQFYLAENTTSNLTFRASHGAADNLTFSFYLESGNLSALRYNLSYPADNTNLAWRFTPNFTDETYGQKNNLTLLVFNPMYPELNTSLKWNITINHTNAPVVFSGSIANQQATYGTGISINLSEYFSDIDHSDSAYNQTINFTVVSNSSPSSISASLSGWTLTLSASSEVSDYFYVNASDMSGNSTILTNASSNQFLARFVPPTTVPSPDEGGGGGGGGTTTKLQYYSIRIIVPGEIVVSEEDYIEIPIEIENNGQVDLEGINLSSIIRFNNVLVDSPRVSFAYSYIDKLPFGQSRNLSMYINADTHRTGQYRATVYAGVSSPKFTDWADFYINLKKINETDAEQTLVFTEKLIAENPECLELTEVVKEARSLFEKKDFSKSLDKSREAIDACNEAISKNIQIEKAKSRVPNSMIYVGIITLLIFVFWFVFYTYKKVKLNKARVSDYV